MTALAFTSLWAERVVIVRDTQHRTHQLLGKPRAVNVRLPVAGRRRSRVTTAGRRRPAPIGDGDPLDAPWPSTSRRAA